MFLFAEDELCDAVAHAVTDRLYNDDKICKGGPVKKKSLVIKLLGGRGRARKTFLCHNHFLHVIYVLAFVTSIAFVYPRCCFLTL